MAKLLVYILPYFEEKIQGTFCTNKKFILARFVKWGENYRSLGFPINEILMKKSQAEPDGVETYDER